jgi:hypothetical protein
MAPKSDKLPDKLLVTVAPTGAETSKRDCPQLLENRNTLSCEVIGCASDSGRRCLPRADDVGLRLRQ